MAQYIRSIFCISNVYFFWDDFSNFRLADFVGSDFSAWSCILFRKIQKETIRLLFDIVTHMALFLYHFQHPLRFTKFIMRSMSSLVMYRIFFVIALGLVGIFMLFGCQNKTVNIFGSKSPREQYTDKLRSAGLSDTKTGRLWNQTAASVLENAPKIEVPTQLLGSFKARTISARAWQFDLQKGASVEISVQWAPADSSKLFVDLIQWTGRADILSSFAPGDDVHKFEAKQTGTYIVRLQPELLGEGNFVLNISGTATYSVFPVDGKDSRAIMS